MNKTNTKKEIEHEWAIKVRENHDAFTAAVLELKKKHNTIYKKIQDEAESLIGERIGEDVEDEEF